MELGGVDVRGSYGRLPLEGVREHYSQEMSGEVGFRFRVSESDLGWWWPTQT